MKGEAKKKCKIKQKKTKPKASGVCTECRCIIDCKQAQQHPLPLLLTFALYRTFPVTFSAVRLPQSTKCNTSQRWVWSFCLDFLEDITMITVITVTVPPHANPGAQRFLFGCLCCTSCRVNCCSAFSSHQSSSPRFIWTLNHMQLQSFYLLSKDKLCSSGTNHNVSENI